MESIIEFLNSFTGFLDTIPAQFDSYWDRAVAWLIITYIEIKIESMVFAATIAQSIIANIGLSEIINTAWSSIDSQIVMVLNYCRVPDAINLILTAYVTRFILALIPF